MAVRCAVIIDLKKVFLNGECVNIEPYYADIEIGDLLLRKDIKDFNILISGRAYMLQDNAHIKLDINLEFDCCCDSCASDIHNSLSYSFEEVVKALSTDSDADSVYVVSDNYTIDIDKIVREYIILNFPSRLLCKPDCLGICQVCGKNLNEGKCNCTVYEPDSKFSVLKQLLH